MRIRWTMPAADDLEAIKDYVEANYPQLSHSTIRKLYDGIRSLRFMPERGRAGRKPGVREIIFHPLPYIVSYSLAGETIEILRIHHGAQDRTEH